MGRVQGVGAVTYVKLIQRFGSPEAVFRASFKELCDVERVGARVAKAIKEFEDRAWVEEEMARMEGLGACLVGLGQERYPAALASIADPPPFLYVKGELLPEDRVAVAIVGSRAASQYGLKTTRRMARDLARNGITIVSGMARGIDSEAHRGALEGGGRTIAVLGSGLDVVYPPENRDLYQRIAQRGAVVSEYPFGTEPDGVHFPQRNRIISGMSMAVTIVEAAPKSGSLITADLALEQGREVFAVPGSVDSLRSRGTHQLIRQGAHLAESAEDILAEIKDLLVAWGTQVTGSQAAAIPQEPFTEQEERILAMLGPDPVQIDELIQKGGFGSSLTTALLLQLELRGAVRQLPGKWFVKVER